jgi:hypothetical protein
MKDFKDIFMDEADRQGIWLPPSASSMGERDLDKKETVTAEIRNAKYHIDEETIALTVVLPDGTERVTYLTKDLYTFGGGRGPKEVPKDESDKAMLKLANEFVKARGKRIKIEMYRHQLEK